MLLAQAAAQFEIWTGSRRRSRPCEGALRPSAAAEGDDALLAPGALRPHRRDGQQRIRASRVLVVGCGALGSALAEMLVRAGVGR